GRPRPRAGAPRPTGRRPLRGHGLGAVRRAGHPLPHDHGETPHRRRPAPAPLRRPSLPHGHRLLPRGDRPHRRPRPPGGPGVPAPARRPRDRPRRPAPTAPGRPAVHPRRTRAAGRPARTRRPAPAGARRRLTSTAVEFLRSSQGRGQPVRPAPAARRHVVTDSTTRTPTRNPPPTPADIPDRYRHAVVPHIMVDDADAAIAFYRRAFGARSEEHTSELQSRENLVCRLLLE